jgi:cytochrome c biogenesis protein ResB
MATLVPQSALQGTEAVAAWRAANPLLALVTGLLGMHSAYTAPVFLLVAVALTFSTAACAWQRTRSFIGWRKTAGDVTPRVHARMADAPTTVLEYRRTDAEDVRERVESALSAAGLSHSRVSDVWVGVSGLTTGVGSALFHWALAALFAVAGVGQAMKWEGQLGVLEGQRVADAPADYGLLTKGPFSGQPGTGYEIEVVSIDLEHLAGGVERGHAPLVRLYEDGAAVAESYVYPNSPLRRGSVYIHRGEWGLGAIIALETTDGAEVGRRNLFFDFESTRKDGSIPLVLDMPAETGAAEVVLEARLTRVSGGFIRDVPRDERLYVTEVRSPDSTRSPQPQLDVGRSLPLPSGDYRLRLVDYTRYARLFVVDDWSILWVYALLVVAVIACAVALFARPRTVYARIGRSGPEVTRVDVLVTARRNDPLFKERMIALLAAKADSCDERVR